MTILMSSLVGIGLMLKYVLPHGGKRWAEYGANVHLNFLGMDRHEWGSIHFMMGITLSLLVALHIVLHWDVIKCVFRQLIYRSKARCLIAILFALICMSLIVAPLLIKPSVVDRGNNGDQGYGHGWEPTITDQLR